MMSESVEGIDGVSKAFWMKMDNSPLFVQDPSDNPASNAARESLRAEFFPMALFLEQHGELPVGAEPEAIIAAAIGSPTLALDEANKASLQSFIPDSQNVTQKRDWMKEATEMSMQGSGHPVRQLRNKVVERLLPPAQLKLSIS